VGIYNETLLAASGCEESLCLLQLTVKQILETGDLISGYFPQALLFSFSRWETWRLRLKKRNHQSNCLMSHPVFLCAIMNVWNMG